MAEGESVLVVAAEEDRPFYRALRPDRVNMLFTSGAEAAAVLDQGGVGVLVLDGGHETEGGIATLADFKRAFPSVPIIFLADLIDEDSAVRLLRAGAREYFRKDSPVSEIQRSVTTLLRLRRCCTEYRESLTLCQPETGTGHGLKIRPNLPEGLVRAICSMHDHLAGTLCLDSIAKEAGMSKYHFSRVFKRHCGTSPMQFLCWLRVEQAKQLLVKPDLKISSVAFSVGFNEIGEFNRQFKKVTGISPSKYRSCCAQGLGLSN